MKKVIYKGIDLSLFDSNTTGNYKVYRALNGYKFMFSYDTLIAIRDMHGRVLVVTNYYNYSRTTSRHLYKFCEGYTNTTAKDLRSKEDNVSYDERTEKVNECLNKIKQDIERWAIRKSQKEAKE